jgi:hypothetical protein
MKRIIVTALLVLVLSTASASAHDWGISAGFCGHSWSCGPNNVTPGVLGPWYLYWPYEAHFAMPAHPQFPYWPSNQSLPGGAPVVAQPTMGGYHGYGH